MDGTNAPSGTYGGSLTAYDMDESVYIDVPYFIDNDTVSISEITFTNMLMGVEMFSDDTRNALFTKDKFKNEIVSTFGYKVENIKVSELSNLLMDSIERIELTSVYNDYFILNIANSSYRINSMSSDESIAVRTVVLS